MAELVECARLEIAYTGNCIEGSNPPISAKINSFCSCKKYLIIQIMNTFYEQVYDIVERIPVGKVVTYGDIAKMLGRPRAARLVGYAMGTACETDNRPWHRVTFSDGKLWDNQWEHVQREMLSAEGVGFTPDGKIDVEKYRWHPETDGIPLNLHDMPLKF